MPDKRVESPDSQYAGEPRPPHTVAEKVGRLFVVGGSRIVREAICSWLGHQGMDITCSRGEDENLCRWLGEQEQAPDVLVLLLSGGPFSTFHRIQGALAETSNGTSLVVVSEEAGRGQIYAALRIGAKAYVSLDSDPQELLKAIGMAARGRVYLTPEAAELVVNDISSSSDSSASAGRLPSAELSRREEEIVQLLCEGLSSKEIARQLHISPKTVENHRYNIYRKCNVESIAALMRHAIQHGMVTI